MQAFLREWLDELSAMDSLRFGATCREARETLGADGVAAAAFAVTRPWRPAQRQSWLNHRTFRHSYGIPG